MTHVLMPQHPDPQPTPITRKPSIRATGFVGAWLLGLVLSTPAMAHETLPTQWCMDPSLTPLVVARFDISPEALSEYQRNNPVLRDPPSDPSCAERSCGIVDDWFWANQMIHDFCALSQTASLAPISSAMPFVQAPAVFNAKDHHESYSFQSGRLTGACVVCVPAKTEATPQSPNDAGI